MVVGAQKAHSLRSSISWKPGKPGCSSQSKAKGLRSWGVADVSPWVQGPEKLEFQCWMAGEDGCPRSGRDGEFTLPLPFCAIGPSRGSMGPPHTGEGRSSQLGHWFNCSFVQTPSLLLDSLYRFNLQESPLFLQSLALELYASFPANLNLRVV